LSRIRRSTTPAHPLLFVDRGRVALLLMNVLDQDAMG
jgi:hypothetical protein